MKNKIQFSIILITIMILTLTQAHSQSLEIVKCDTLVKGTAFETLYSHAKIKNISASPKDVKVKMLMEDLFPGQKASICFGTCGQPQTTDYEHFAYVTIQPSDTYDAIELSLYPYTNIGNSKIELVFFVRDNPDDNVEYTAYFEAGPETSIHTEINNIYQTVSAAPNPANNFIYFNYGDIRETGKAQINIYNSLGILLNSIDIDNSSNGYTFDTSSLPDGMYYYSLNINGKKPKGDKLIIIH